MVCQPKAVITFQVHKHLFLKPLHCTLSLPTDTSSVTRNHLNSVQNWGSRKHAWDPPARVCRLRAPGKSCPFSGTTPVSSPQRHTAAPLPGAGEGALLPASVLRASLTGVEIGSPACPPPLCRLIAYILRPGNLPWFKPARSPVEKVSSQCTLVDPVGPGHLDLHWSPICFDVFTTRTEVNAASVSPQGTASFPGQAVLISLAPGPISCQAQNGMG